MLFQKILVALDYSDQHESVFATALVLAKKTDAHLILLHILSMNDPNELALPIFDCYYPTVSEELVRQGLEQRRAIEERGLEMLRSLANQATAAGVSAEVMQKMGDPGQTICAIAKDQGVNLIVVGRRGHSRLGELLLGSVSNAVIHRAPCSVLVVQSQAENELEATARSKTHVNL